MECIRRATPFRNPFKPLPEVGSYIGKSFPANTIHFAINETKVSFLSKTIIMNCRQCIRYTYIYIYKSKWSHMKYYCTVNKRQMFMFMFIQTRNQWSSDSILIFRQRVLSFRIRWPVSLSVCLTQKNVLTDCDVIVRISRKSCKQQFKWGAVPCMI